MFSPLSEHDPRGSSSTKRTPTRGPKRTAPLSPRGGTGSASAAARSGARGAAASALGRAGPILAVAAVIGLDQILNPELPAGGQAGFVANGHLIYKGRRKSASNAWDIGFQYTEGKQTSYAGALNHLNGVESWYTGASSSPNGPAANFWLRSGQVATDVAPNNYFALSLQQKRVGSGGSYVHARAIDVWYNPLANPVPPLLPGINPPVPNGPPLPKPSEMPDGYPLAPPPWVWPGGRPRPGPGGLPRPGPGTNPGPKPGPDPRPRPVQLPANLAELYIDFLPDGLKVYTGAARRPPKGVREVKMRSRGLQALATLVFVTYEAVDDWKDWLSIVGAATPGLEGLGPWEILDRLRRDPGLLTGTDWEAVLWGLLGWSIDELVGMTTGKIQQKARDIFNGGPLAIKYGPQTEQMAGGTLGDYLTLIARDAIFG